MLQKYNFVRRQMNDHEQGDRCKIIILLAMLTVIWGMCNSVEQRLPDRFQEELVVRMGKRALNIRRVELIRKLQSNILNDQIQDAQIQLNQQLRDTYNLETQLYQQPILVIFRDFTNTQIYPNYGTIKSIVSQNYTNFKIVHLRQKNATKQPKLQRYLKNKNISTQRYTLINTQHDTISTLFNASAHYRQNAIVVLVQNKEKFVSPLVFKIINSYFTESVDFAWATSLYNDGRLGFSFDYSQTIKTNKNFRSYPLPINDVIIFRNSFLSKCRSFLRQHHLYYPLSMPESFAWTFLQNTNKTKYIPEVLSTKPKNGTYRSERSEFQRDLELLIRDNKPMGSILQKQLYHTQS